MTSVPYALTPADIMAHRLWYAKGSLAACPDGMDRIPCAYMTVSPSDGTLYIHSGGRTVAGAQPPHVMHALLWAERIEPGFCRQAADPSLTIEECLRSPQERQEARRWRDHLAATQRADKAAADDLARRRRTQLINPVSKIPTAELTLDDLFS